MLFIACSTIFNCGIYYVNVNNEFLFHKMTNSLILLIKIKCHGYFCVKKCILLDTLDIKIEIKVIRICRRNTYISY